MNKFKMKCLTAASVVSLVVAGNAVAQDAPPEEEEGRTLQVVQVTAQRKSESAQDVPIAINAFSGAQTEELGIDQPIDLAAQTPGLFIKNGIGSGNPYISIRNVGQSLFVSNASQPVGMYLNDVNLSYTNLMSVPIYDVERVEVLKGPQGTLFGRNSTGGALSTFTVRPRDDFEAGFTAGIGNNALFEADGFLNIPVTDNWATRVAFTTKRQDGFYTNLLNDNSIGGTDSWAARLSNRWVASESVEVNLITDIHFDRSGNAPWTSYGIADPTDPVTAAELAANGLTIGDGVDFTNGNAFGRNEVYGGSSFIAAGLGADACGENNTIDELIAANVAGQCVTHLGQTGDGDLLTGRYSLEPQIVHDYYSQVVDIDIDLGWADLKSISAYINSDRVFEEEFDGTEAISADNTYREKTELFSQELRLSGSNDLLDWVAGAYYAHDEIDKNDTYEYDDIWFFTNNPSFTQTTDNFGIFGHTNWQLTDRLGLILAARYTDETIGYEGGNFIINVVDPDIDAVVFGILPLVEGQVTRPPAGFDELQSDDITWKAGLDFQLTDDILLYAFASRGVKSGGYNGTWTVTDDELRPYTKEELTDYELGFKSNLLSNTLQINGGAFFYDYRDLQAFVLDSNFLFTVDNIPKTEIVGAELDVNWLATDNLEIRGGVSYTDAEIKEVTPDQIANGILVGNTTANSANWMVNGLAKYRFAVSENYEASAQVDFNYQSETFFTVQNTSAASQDDLWLTNARVTFEPNEGPWSAALWIKNIADERYVTEAFPDPAEGLIAYNVGRPRTYGASLSYEF